MKTVFIGGTGRCGTNLLKEIFSFHSQVATLPFEQRFIIDPDGIIDTYISMKSMWSPFVIDKKIKRLEKLLENVSYDKFFQKLIAKILRWIDESGKLISPHKYIGWELNKYFPNFAIRNDMLISDLCDFYYDGVYPGTESYSVVSTIRHNAPMPDEDLVGIFRHYLNNVIGDFLKSQEKNYFVDDNTWNIFFARELLEILPDSKIVCIKRDRDNTVQSMLTQRWCPNHIDILESWYTTMVAYWNKIKKDLPPDSFCEVCFDELVVNPRFEILKLCEFIDIPFEESLLKVEFDESKVKK